MSPILDMQRRFAEVGRIRAGAKGAKGQPQKLDAWRLTGANEQALRAAGELYGGEVREWVGAPTPGQFELFTDSRVLDVMVPPSQEPYSLWYETWSGGGCERRCDGVRDHLSDAPCACSPDDRRCKPTLRVSLALHRIPGLGVWRYESHGFYAASELPATLDLLAAAAGRGQYLTGFLRLEERVSKSKANGTRRYLVPVLDLEQTIGELAGLPSPRAGQLAARSDGADGTAGIPQVALGEIGSPESETHEIADGDTKRRIWRTAQLYGLDKEGIDRLLAEIRGADAADVAGVLPHEVETLIGRIETEGSL